MNKPRVKPSSPNFSSGPTKKPDVWSARKLNTNILGRYHRSEYVKEYIENIFKVLRKTLKIPEDYKFFLTPGSCTGAVESIIWSILGKNKITTIITDHWGEQWSSCMKSLNYKVDVRGRVNGKIPYLKKINSKNDIFFVWTGTTTGISFKDLNWIKKDHQGLVVSDITSAVFVDEIEWKKVDISAFSWQKALGSESQHGVIVMSPKAIKKIKDNTNKIIPKILDITNLNYPINTPSLLCFSDFEFCLNWYIKKGGLIWAKNICKKNKLVLDKWIKKNKFLKYFSSDPTYRSISSSFFILKNQKFSNNLINIINYLNYNQIAYDISSYRKSPLGIRIWTGPTIKKKDLIALTNWLDWCFYKFF